MRVVTLVMVTMFWLLGVLHANDMTHALEYLGTPLKARYSSGEALYARNVWDMQLYDGRIFIGAGNSSNHGPAKNAGPVPVVSYDITQKRFVTENKLPEEQIDLFKVYAGELVVPGHDTTQSWKWGNYYKRTIDDRWKQYRNVPKGLHLYDMVLKNGIWYAGVGLYEGAAVAVSKDGGASWQMQTLGRSRVYSFLPIGNQLYALKKFKRTSKPYFSVAQLQEDGTFQPLYFKSIYTMFPDTTFKEKYSRVIRVVSFDERALYIGAYKYNDHQSKPFGLYLAKRHNNDFLAQRIQLSSGVTPRDILMRDQVLYLLGSRIEGGQVVNGVWQSSVAHPYRWEELFSFKYATFARSFEKSDNAFYFGMGSDVKDSEAWSLSELHKETGDILRIAYSSRVGGE